MPEFTAQLTGNLESDLYSQLDELEHYDFTEVNILALEAEMSRHVVSAATKTIIELFDQFSYQSTWSDETSKNIHYFNGWKTNKAWYINKKVIQRINGVIV